MSSGCAVIVEPRKHKSLLFVVQQVEQSLQQSLPQSQDDKKSDDWPIYLLHGLENKELAQEVKQTCHSVHLILLPVTNMTIRDYNNLLTDPSFYKQFQAYEYCLIFQTDSVLFPNSPFDISYFLGYDYVGAPWKWNKKHPGGNGGLSLRKIQTMIDILTTYPYNNNACNEDVYICRLPITCAPFEMCQKFSVESVFYPTPFGVHKPWLYLSVSEYVPLYKYAPTIKTLVDLN